jgi:D-sedoheptulose 7-phosphate isomerase
MAVPTALAAGIVDACFARRVAPLERLGEHADLLALAARDVAARLARGGRLLLFAGGGATTDAAHVAVEFVHPVGVGKPSLPALSLTADVASLLATASSHGLDQVFAHQVRLIGGPDDVAVGLSVDGRSPAVAAGLRAARDAGLLTVALLGGDGGAIARDRLAEHCLVNGAPDAHLAKEAHVTTYHVLWELVHVFLDHPEAMTDAPPPAAGGVEQLYPFLYGGGGGSQQVLTEAVVSTRVKVADVLALRHEVLQEQRTQLATCAGRMAEAFDQGATLLAFGNGGSSTDAQELTASFMAPPSGRPLPALCLTNDVAIVTALSNDIGFDVVFARQVEAFGRPGDIAVGLSTSGGSPNVLAGLRTAKERGMTTIGLAGYGGGQMATLGAIDHLFTVPSSSVHRVQEVQTTIYHVLWELVQQALPSRAAATAT